MFTTVTVKRVGFGFVYKLIAVGMACGMVPLGVVFGVMAYFGANTVTWNARPLTGVAGLLGGPLMGVFVAAIFTALVGSVCVLGLWLFSLVRTMQITYKTEGSPVDFPGARSS